MGKGKPSSQLQLGFCQQFGEDVLGTAIFYSVLVSILGTFVVSQFGPAIGFLVLVLSTIWLTLGIAQKNATENNGRLQPTPMSFGKDGHSDQETGTGYARVIPAEESNRHLSIRTSLRSRTQAWFTEYSMKHAYGAEYIETAFTVGRLSVAMGDMMSRERLHAKAIYRWKESEFATALYSCLNTFISPGLSESGRGSDGGIEMVLMEQPLYMDASRAIGSRRADIVALTSSGIILIIEVKYLPIDYIRRIRYDRSKPGLDFSIPYQLRLQSQNKRGAVSKGRSYRGGSTQSSNNRQNDELEDWMFDGSLDSKYERDIAGTLFKPNGKLEDGLANLVHNGIKVTNNDHAEETTTNAHLDHPNILTLIEEAIRQCSEYVDIVRKLRSNPEFDMWGRCPSGTTSAGQSLYTTDPDRTLGLVAYGFWRDVVFIPCQGPGYENFMERLKQSDWSQYMMGL